MSAEDEQTKRQRQKERRAAKRAEHARAVSAAKRRRTLATVGVVVLVLAGIGALLSGQIRDFLDRRALVAEAEERLGDFGCTGIEEMPHLGGGHFSGEAAELSAAAPETVYEHLPTTSGPHVGQVVITGVYDDYVDERLTTHNMEHGYVIVRWDPDLPADEIAEIQDWAEERIDEGYEKLVAAPYEGALPDGGNVALTAWNHRQLCDAFDPTVGEAFLLARHDDPDVPEAAAGPHFGGNPGELDPAEDAVVFTPFTTAVPGASAMEAEPADVGEDGDEADGS